MDEATAATPLKLKGGNGQPASEDAQQDGPPAKALRDRLHWLIRLRWIAIACIVSTVLAAHGLGAILQPAPILVISSLMCLYNLAFLVWLRDRARPPSADVLERTPFLQLFLDIIALTAMLHLAGGAANPFVALFAFPIALGAALLSRRKACLLGVAVVFLHGGAVLAESLDLLPRRGIHFATLAEGIPAAAIHHQPLWVSGYLLALLLAVFGIIYFVQSVAQQRRDAEALCREREQIAVSRERLARIGELSAGVAHSIRNPLYGLLNCANLLRDGDENDDAEEVVELMLEGLAQIDIVTQRLLRFSRDDPLQKVPTEIDSLIRDTIPLIEVKAHKETVPIRLELSPIPEVEVDPTRFSEAFFNVVHNAVDASLDGAEVVVKSSEVTTPQPGVRIDVIDTGTGIPEAHLPGIFDPFFTSKPAGKGTGLGLPIAKRIMEEHGGKLTVESQVGQGTRVSLLLPLTQTNSERGLP